MDHCQEKDAQYGKWIGKPVTILVLAGDIRTPLRGWLAAEMNDRVRLRIAESWDVDIYKRTIIDVLESEDPTIPMPE